MCWQFTLPSADKRGEVIQQQVSSRVIDILMTFLLLWALSHADHSMLPAFMDLNVTIENVEASGWASYEMTSLYLVALLMVPTGVRE